MLLSMPISDARKSTEEKLNEPAGNTPAMIIINKYGLFSRTITLIFDNIVFLALVFIATSFTKNTSIRTATAPGIISPLVLQYPIIICTQKTRTRSLICKIYIIDLAIYP